LCFELLKRISAAQNHLPLQGAEKLPKSVFFLSIEKIILLKLEQKGLYLKLEVSVLCEIA